MEKRSARRATDLLLAALPHLLFLALLAASWRRWLVPFQDHGRELETPWRLARGEFLYRDVSWYFGPLPAYLDAAALRLFGFHADVLVALRTLAGLLGVEALRRLARRLAGGSAAASVASAAAVSLCAFGVTGAWPFPYSAAALYGSVAAWWGVELALASTSPAASALAALLAGLAAGTKLELAPAAVASLAAALWWARSRREAAAGTFLALLLGAAAWGGPLLLLGRETLVDHGFLVALRVAPAWRLGERALLLGGHAEASFFPAGVKDLLVPSLPYLGAALLLAIVPLPARFASLRVAPALLPALLGAASVAWPFRQALHLLLVAAWLLLAASAWGVLRRGRGAPAWAGPALAVGLAMAPALARQPLFLRFEGYLAFTAPLAVVLVLSLGTRLPNRAAAIAFVATLAASQGIAKGLEWRRTPVEPVETGTVRFLQPVEEARFLNAAIAAIGERTPPDARVASFPEPGFLLVASGRRNPFVDTQFYPGCQTPRSEASMAEVVRRDPPAAILEVERETWEFGPATPRHGLLDAVYREVDLGYAPAFGLGRAGPPPRLAGRHAAHGLLLLPRLAIPREGARGNPAVGVPSGHVRPEGGSR